jgi:LmbE family N-acetylglucosaminyl deacetylase
MNPTHADTPEKSIVVVAHPDDEALWLSSVLGDVDRILFCYEECSAATGLGAGRRKALAEYPLDNAGSLGLAEAVSFNTADWNNPVETEYGLLLAKNVRANKRYQETFSALLRGLTPILGGFRHVFTHNPWGEYGHEDHVQVYRAVKALQSKLGFNLWFSNYCGQQAVPLMMRYVSGFSNDYMSRPTNPELAGRLRELYVRHGCWTWYDDYQWFKEEAVMPDRALPATGAAHGHIFPVNMLKTDFIPSRESGYSFGTVLRRLFRSDG